MSEHRRFGFNDYGVLEWLAPTPRITAGAPTLSITRWRFRDDDLSSPNNTPTWLDSGESGNPSAAIGTGQANSFVIRIQADEVNNKTGSWTLQLEYNKGGAGWNAVGSASSNVRMYGATSRGGISDDAAVTTPRLTAPTGSYENGTCDTATGSVAHNNSTNGSYMEHEYIVYFVDADVANADTIQFRITGHNGTGGTLGTVTVSKADIQSVSATDGAKATDAASVFFTAHSISVTDGAKAGDAASASIPVNEESATLWACGFEDEDSSFANHFTGKSEGSGNTCSVQSTTVRSGSNAASIAFGGSNNTAYFYKSITITGSDTYARCYFDVGSLAAGAGQYLNVIALLDSGTLLGGIWIDESGGQWRPTLRINVPSAGFVDFGSYGDLAPGTFHRLEIHWKQDGSAGGIEAWIDGNLLGQDFTRDTSSYQPDEGRLGTFSGGLADSGTCYFDDVRAEESGPIGGYLEAEQAIASDGAKAGDAAAITITDQSVTATDGAEPGDAASVAPSLAISASDGAEATDAASATTDLPVAATDGGEASDAAAVTTELATAALDGAEPGDQAAAQITGQTVSASDGAEAGDSAGVQLSLPITSSDGAEATDAAGATTEALTTAPAADGAKAGDTAVASIAAQSVQAADGAEPGDAATEQLSLALSASDGGEAGDSAAVQTSLGAAAIDGSEASDATNVQAALSVPASDGSEASDEAAISITAQSVQASDGVKAGDSAAVSIGGVEEVAATDGAEAGDASILAVTGQQVSAEDGAEAGDAADLAITYQVVTAEDGAVAGDTASVSIAGTESVNAADGAEAGDAVDALLAAAMEAFESGLASDEASAALAAGPGGSDGAVAGASVTVTLRMTITASDGAESGDAASGVDLSATPARATHITGQAIGTAITGQAGISQTHITGRVTLSEELEG